MLTELGSGDGKVCRADDDDGVLTELGSGDGKVCGAADDGVLTELGADDYSVYVSRARW